MAATLDHASLGQIKGIRPSQYPHVEQYLGIQYAELADAFARGTLIETSQGPLQATAVGPLPVANPQNCDNEHKLFQHTLPHPDYQFSPTECLTLNVSVPSESKAAGSLPVVVLIHGGGFFTGSANWPQYDLANIVERSEKLGQPVVAVGVNYRLGAFGFLTSSALRDAGYKANNGLDDQRLALQWVKKHIPGFGGDPSKVTLLGSSAGAASAFFHLQSNEPLFTQIIALGGSPLIQPLPPPVTEIAFGIVTNALGLGDRAPAEQIKAMLALPAQELAAKLAGVPIPFAPAVDGDLVKNTPSYAGLADVDSLEKLFPGITWCKTIVMGDCQLDGMIMPIGGRPDNVGASLKKCLETVFADDAAKVAAMVEGYGIDTTKDDKLPVVKFINDIAFALSVKSTAQAWARAGARLGTKAYLMHFNMPNPWEGPWKGNTTHALDVAIALGNYNEFLGEGQKSLAEKLAGDIIGFVNGKEPYSSYSGAADATRMVYYAGAESKEDVSGSVNNVEESVTGRSGLLEVLTGGDPLTLDKLLGGFKMFMQGPPK